MASPATPQPKELTAAQRDWIRRQGKTARALAAEQKRSAQRLAAAAADTLRSRKAGGRFRRTGG
jgi:hypothetical protein